MRLHVVNCVEWLVVDNSEGARGQRPDKKGSDEAWGIGDCDCIDIFPAAVCIFECFSDNWIDYLQMTSRGNLRNDSSIFGMNVDL